jgi:hypothetical protein
MDEFMLESITTSGTKITAVKWEEN